MSEFPDAKMVVVEIGSMTPAIKKAEYEYAADQVDYTDIVTGDDLSKYDGQANMMLNIKKSFPLALLYYTQFNSWLEVEKANTVFASEENEYFEECLKLMRSRYDGQICFVYHHEIDPDITDINEDNSICSLVDICAKYDIQVINMVPVFEEYYLKTSKLPYGFNNSTIGKGHLNKVGHALIAKAIYEYMEGGL